MVCIKWSQPTHTSFGWNAIPARHSSNKLRREPQNRPPFLPTAKPHPLNSLTHGPPPMYWLGTSRWCHGPLCELHSICVCPLFATLALSGFVVCTGLCLSFVAWRMRGLLSLCFLPFILSWVGYCPHKCLCLHSLLGPCFFVSLLHGCGPFSH